MKTLLGQRLISGTLLAFFLLLLCILPVFSHEGEEHDEDENEAVADTSLTDSATAVRDSIYADINKEYLKVRHIFENSCFDCHSKFTKYPWYHKLPLVGWLIDEDIEEGREHLDFSNDFPFGGHHSQQESLKDMREEIEEGDMPILSYRIMHWGKLIEGAQQDSVFKWIDESLNKLK